jgi:hypothetical protein
MGAMDFKFGTHTLEIHLVFRSENFRGAGGPFEHLEIAVGVSCGEDAQRPMWRWMPMGLPALSSMKLSAILFLLMIDLKMASIRPNSRKLQGRSF